MNVPKLWILILNLLYCIGQIWANIDSKEYFCGRKLMKTLDELCAVYNNPTYGRHRFRRQIVDECCRSQCSRRYILQYYCSEAKSSVASLLLKPIQESTSKTSSSDKDIMDYQSDFGSRIERNSLTVGTTEEVTSKNVALITPKSTHYSPIPSKHNNQISHRNRNCKCRRRRAKRIKKFQHLQPGATSKIIRKPAPPPNIGHVENSQTPFYIWRFSRMF